MSAIARTRVVILCLAMTAASCSSRPSAEVDAARAALEKANADRAGQYASQSLKAAEDARAALDAELKIQDEKWLKSYNRTRQLAAAAKAAADKASADAVAGKQKADAAAVKAKADAAARAKTLAAAVHVGGPVKAPTKIKDVRPVYPQIARSAKVSGTVVVDATIGPDGKVEDAKVVKSVPLLDQAALDAVRQWQYTPTVMKGKPVPVRITVSIVFRP
jgi:TonB family protein